MTDRPPGLATQALQTPGLTTTERLVLVALAARADGTGDLAVGITEAGMARSLGLTLRSLRRTLDRLIALGYVSER